MMQKQIVNPRTPKKNFKKVIQSNLTAYSFIIISLITLLFTVYVPMISTIKYSLYKVSLMGFGEQFVGLDNYRMLFAQSTFWRSIGNTIIMAVLGLLTVPFGFLLANMINSLGKGRVQEFFRVGFYLPNIITGVSVYLIFQVILMGNGGLLNNLLSTLFGQQITIGWLSDSRFSKIGATILWIWMNLGYSMLINLASLQAIPTDLYEAASIDGASSTQKMFHITIPNMKSCFTLLFITGMISGLARFADIFIISGSNSGGGAGGSLQTILMYIFQFSFETPNYGVSSAGSMVLFALVFVMTMVNVKLTNFLSDEV